MCDLSVVESIFEDALKLDDRDDLSAFLTSRCPDLATRRQVEKLLAARQEMGTFLSQPIGEGAFQDPRIKMMANSVRVI